MNWLNLYEKIKNFDVIYVYSDNWFSMLVIRHLTEYDLPIEIIDDEFNNENMTDYKKRNIDFVINDDRKKCFLIPYSGVAGEIRRYLINCGLDKKNIFFVYHSNIPWKRLSFEVQVAEHCNLKCKYCNHFSPLASPGFLSVDEFEKDIKRISQLTNGDIKKLTLLGGEPLLNPNLGKICEIARLYFKDTKIVIISNGILLSKKNPELWTICAKNNIELNVTHYPVKINYEKNEEYVRSFGVKVNVFQTVEAFNLYPLDVNCKSSKENFNFCYLANECILLSHGKLYPCAAPANVKYINEKIGNEFFELSEHDGVDIYSNNSIEDILIKLAKPMPFCKYCNYKIRCFDLGWERSECDYKEWVA